MMSLCEIQKPARPLIGILRFTFLVVILFSNPATAQSESPNPDDIYWSDQFAGGVMGSWGEQANALCNYGGELIVTGYFEWEGTAIARNIVAWDGANWHALGDGVVGWPLCLTTFGDKLVVGGQLTKAGETPVSAVAQWDGVQWANIGSGLSGEVTSIVEYRSQLFAAGTIGIAGFDSAFKLAVWNRDSWKPSSQNFDGPIYCLAVFKDLLYAGGAFTLAGDTVARYIARFDDTVWSAVAGGTDSAVVSLVASDSVLFVGGLFDSVGALSARHVAVWDGEQWVALGDGVAGVVNSMTMLGDSLVVQGAFSIPGPDSTRSFLAWHGQSWSPLPPGPRGHGWVSSCASFQGKLAAAGRRAVASLWEYQLAVLDGQEWKIPYQMGCNNRVVGFGAYGNKLIVCGAFDVAGGVISPSLAAWDGANWYGMTDSTKRANGFWTAKESEVYQGELYVGGNFQPDGPLPIECLGAWNGTSWRSIPNGPYGGSVKSLFLWRDKLVVGGTFALEGNNDAAIAQYDGNSWQFLGDGLRSKLGFTAVWDVTSVDSNLVVCGNFDTAGVIAINDIAVWDGRAWVGLGDGLGAGPTSSARCLAEFQEALVAGGNFSNSGDTPVSSIAQWNGSNWQPLGSGIRLGSQTGYVNAMTVYDNQLIVAGWFDSAGGVPARNIAAWDGSKWTALGSGTDTMGMGWSHYSGIVWGLGVYNGNLMVGGEFSVAGGKVSSCIAMWTKKNPSDVTETDPNTIPGSLSLLQNYPNPFNPSTTIEYALKKHERVQIDIYNQLGQLVTKLVDEIKSPGAHRVEWDGTDQYGSRVATGVYFYQVRTDDRVDSKKMLLLK